MSERLGDVVAGLVERVARLEAVLQARPGVGGTVEPFVTEGAGGGVVTYRGSGPWGDSVVAWDLSRSWDDVVATAADGPARVLSALANPSRLRLVSVLVAGPASTASLADAVDAATSGQLFHHLKELLAAGVIHQPRRGVYALRPQHVVALLAIVSAASDVAAVTETTPA